MACATKHFFVLLLAHALAALLDQRTHKGYEPIGTMTKTKIPIPYGARSGVVQRQDNGF